MAASGEADAVSRNFLIVCTNVGSLGCNRNLKEHNIKVRRKLTDTVTSIRTKYRSDNLALCVQECGHFDVSLRPHFGTPLVCDDHVTYGANDNGVMGVATYSVGGNCTGHNTGDTTNEICTISASLCNSRGRLIKVGIINCYRNISKNYERSIEQTKAAITKQINALEAVNIKTFIICGDFNSTSFKYDEKNARELSHVAWYHQANDHTAKHRIDKCFTNMANAGILEILPSCENVMSASGHHLGHKVCVIFVGKEPTDVNETPRKITSYKKLIDLAMHQRHVFSQNDNSSCRGLEDMAVELTNVVTKLHARCQIEKVQSKKNAQAVLVSRLEGFKDGVISKANAAKVFYESKILVAP